jgi:hypothetical protein
MNRLTCLILLRLLLPALLVLLAAFPAFSREINGVIVEAAPSSPDEAFPG